MNADWKAAWDLENFSNRPVESMPYGYSGSGLIILEDEVKDDSHKLYNPDKAAQLNKNSTGDKKYYSERT